jgi:hypothetical protein
VSVISGLPRGFSTCCLRFKNGVATTHAKLASGWLSCLVIGARSSCSGQPQGRPGHAGMGRRLSDARMIGTSYGPCILGQPSWEPILACDDSCSSESGLKQPVLKS